MKKLVMSMAAGLLFSASAMAATGWFEDYVIVSIDGGADQYYWIGADPGFGTQFDGADLGSLTTLSFGADLKYWGDNGDTREGGALNVEVDGGGFTEYIWSHASIGGNDAQGTLASTTIDVTAGLTPGTYTVSVWAKSWGQNASGFGGDSFLSNGGANYTASFTVVPEPGTLALFGLGMAGLAVARSRRA